MDSSANVRFIDISLTVNMQGNAKPGALVRGLLPWCGCQERFRSEKLGGERRAVERCTGAARLGG